MGPGNARHRFSEFFWLVLLLSAMHLPMHAQTFNLGNGREPVASLNGLWRFHTGDNPQWADPNFDDSQWPLLRSDKDWAKQGYKGYSGYAWYRFRVTVPAGLDDVSLLLPPITTSYQVFVDKRQVGSFGRMPPHDTVDIPMAAEYRLPREQASEPREVTVALRVWHWPGWSRYTGGGPAKGGALVGESSLIDAHLQRLRDSRLLSNGGGYSIGILCCIAGIMSMVLFLVRRRETEYLWFALNQLSDAMIYGVAIYANVYPVSLLGRDISTATLEIISTLSFLLLLQKLLRGGISVLFSLAIAASVIPSLLIIALPLLPWFSVGVVDMTQAVCLLIAFVWMCDLLVRRAKEGLPDARLLLAPVLVSVLLSIISVALWASFQLGWLTGFPPQFNLFTYPFPVSSGDFIEALFLVAMLAILSNRFMRSRREEQRLEEEFEAAHSVQALLIPATAPKIPGFAVDSAYHPASSVGGDFFQVYPGNDGSLLIVVGDVSGKGLQAAMTVSTIVGALRGCILRQPAAVVAYLNRVLFGHISGFVTCCAVLISSDDSVTIANAGHLSPYCNGEELTVAAGLPLGMVADGAYDELHFQLAPGDRLTFVSDGVVEARSRSGELFGFERTAAVATGSAKSIAEVARSFGQEDDITVISVARTAALEPVAT
jgi:hypothetical protein